MSIRVLLADDHPLILDALEGLFSLEEDIEVVARCTDGVQAVDAVLEHEPDILVLDMNMPQANGLSVLRALHTQGSRTRVVVLAAAVEDQDLVEALRLGLQGVVLKEMAPHMLVQSIRKVHQGDVWVEKRSITRAVDLMLRREAGGRELAKHLTPRELDIVRMVSTGLRNKEIARRLTVTEGTVKVHLHNICGKLGIDGRMELFKYAQERGLA
ncbi:MAG: response regulator transcription factor [Thermoleophilia bacterium]|nr:response regulator transcription factor [Thermoleophilia bacterium]